MAAIIPINTFETRQNPARTASVHPVDALLGRLGIGSRRGFRFALAAIAEMISNGKADPYTLDWASLAYEDTQGIRRTVAERYSPRTANFMLSALRGILRECWRLGLMNHADYARATDLSSVRGDDHMAGRVLKPEEIKALLQVCRSDPSPAGIRDAAILAVLYGCGLRRAELTALTVEDYSPTDGVLTVKGKGKKVRLAYIVGDCKTALDKWLKLGRGDCGWVFVSVNKAGGLGRTQLTGGAVLQILRRRAEQAKVETFSPHDLRRTTATDLLQRGVDVSTVQRFLGHAHVSTTCLYDRRDEEAKRKAVTLLSLGSSPSHHTQSLKCDVPT